MSRRPRLTTLAALAVSAAFGGLVACRPPGRAPHATGSGMATVVFVNESLDEAVVYAESREGGAERVGTVMAGRTQTLRVPTTGVGRSVTLLARVRSKSTAPRSGVLTLVSGDRVRVTLSVDETILAVLPDSTS